MKKEDLDFALNATSHASRFVAMAAERFSADTDELEARSPTAISVAYVKNRLSDAHESLTAAEGEIGKLIQQSEKN